MADKPLAFAWLNNVGPTETLAADQMEPELAEQCKLQLVKQHTLFKHQTAALLSAVKHQIQLANEIPVYIDESGKRVQVWNPLERVTAEVTAAKALHSAQTEQSPAVAPSSAAVSVNVSSPEAKTSKLLQEQEQILLKFFGAQDKVNQEEAAMLARQANCQEHQVRQYMATLRSNLRSFVQRAQRNAAGKTGTPAGAPGAPVAPDHKSTPDVEGAAAAGQAIGDGSEDAIAQADRARQKAMGRLEMYLDENGGIKDPARAGAFASLMQRMKQDSGEQLGFIVWQAQLQAILKTSRSLTLAKLAAVADLVPTLAAMLKAAEQDQQVSFMRQLLEAVRKLPFPWAMLEGQDLLKKVLQLQKFRVPRVAAAAAALARHWQELGGLGAVPFAVPTTSPRGPKHAPQQPYGPTAAQRQHPQTALPYTNAAQGIAPASSFNPANGGHVPGPAGGLESHASLSSQQGSGSDAMLDERSRSDSMAGVNRQGSGGRPAALGPAQAFTKGLQPRKRSASSVAKPLSADEIVKANAKKRAAGSLAAGPAKVGRLDAAAMAALGKRGLNKSHSQGQTPGLGIVRPALPMPGQPGHPQNGSVHPQGQAGYSPGQASNQQGLLGTLQGQILHSQGQGQGSGHIPVRSLPEQQGQNAGHMPVSSHLHTFGQVTGQAPVVGQGAFRHLPGMPQQGGPGLVPHPAPASPLLAVLSPLGANSLLGPASGLDNLFNEEDVARLQPALSALPSHLSPQTHLLGPHQVPGYPHPLSFPPAHPPQPGSNQQALSPELASAQAANMKATVGWGPPPSIFVAYGPDQIPPGMGEESTELHYQAKRQQGVPEVRYVMPEHISDDPYEPYEVEELQQPAQRPVYLLPFVPVDEEERLKMSQKMQQSGVRDPEHLTVAEPVDVIRHNPSPQDLGPLDMTEYEVPGGFNAAHMHDFGLATAPGMSAAQPQAAPQQQQIYYRGYDQQQWPAEQADPFLMATDPNAFPNPASAYGATQQGFELPLPGPPRQYW